MENKFSINKNKIGSESIFNKKIQYPDERLYINKAAILMTAVTVALLSAMFIYLGSVVPDGLQAGSTGAVVSVQNNVETEIETAGSNGTAGVKEKIRKKNSKTEQKNIGKNQIKNKYSQLQFARLNARAYGARTSRGSSSRTRGANSVHSALGTRFKYEPISISGYTAHNYNNMLDDTGLRGCGAAFARMEQKYNVNAVFAIAVASLESAKGYSPLSGNNYFGMIGMEFDNKQANIMYFGELISGHLYQGAGRDTISEIASRYSRSSTWESKVQAYITLLKRKAF